MEYYAGIDVSLEGASLCVVDATGRIVREACAPGSQVRNGLAAGGGRIRTLGPPSERMYANTEIAADREQWGRRSAEKIWHR